MQGAEQRYPRMTEVGACARPNINRYGVDRLPDCCCLVFALAHDAEQPDLMVAQARAGRRPRLARRLDLRRGFRRNECEYHLALTYRCRADAAGGLGDRRIVYNLPIVSTAAGGGSDDCGVTSDLVQFGRWFMSLVAFLTLVSGEVILILTFILILLGARRLPDIVEQWQNKRSDVGPSHPVLLALTFILGAASLILVLYEFSK